MFQTAVLLFSLSAVCVEATTLDPRFQLSFDGFMVFLKELPALRNRFMAEAEDGKNLSKRIDALEASILKTNKTTATPKDQILSVTKNIRHLDLKLKNITTTVRAANQSLTKLMEQSSNTVEGRANLTQLADDVDEDIADIRDVIDNVTSVIEDLRNATRYLQSNRSELLSQMEGLSKKAEVIEILECDSGFGYVNKSWPQTFTLSYSHPFNATPSVIYSVTRMGIAHGGSYDNNVNVTIADLTKSGMSVTVNKNSYTQLKESEYNWMACNV